MFSSSRRDKGAPVEGDWRQYGAAGAPATTGTHHAAAATANLPGPAPNTAGPHRHDILNRLDPTVDSMSGGVQITGPHTRTAAEHHVPTAANAPAAAVSQPGYGQGEAAYNNAPLHTSNLANKLDPRVDSAGLSKASGALPPGSTTGRHGHAATTGVNAPEGAYGPHTSRVVNAADPRMDSDLDGRAAARGHHGTYQGGAGVYPGPAPNTAGPHRSDLLNKLDPTVDSKPAGAQMRGY